MQRLKLFLFPQIIQQAVKGGMVGVNIRPLSKISDMPMLADEPRPSLLDPQILVVNPNRKEDGAVSSLLLAGGQDHLAPDPLSMDRICGEDQQQLVVEVDRLFNAPVDLISGLHLLRCEPTADPFSLKVAVQTFGKVVVLVGVADEDGVKRKSRLVGTQTDNLVANSGDLFLGQAVRVQLGGFNLPIGQTAALEEDQRKWTRFSQRAMVNVRRSVVTALRQASCAGEIGIGEIGFIEVCLAKVRLAEVHLPEVCPAQVRPEEVRPAQVRPAQVRPVEERLAEERPAKVRLTEVRPEEVHLAEVRLAEVRPEEICLAEVCLAEVRPEEIRLEEVRLAEVRIAEVRPIEVRPTEDRLAEVRIMEVRPTEVRLAEVRPIEVRLAEVRPTEDRPVEIRPHLQIFRPPHIPTLNALVQDLHVFFVGHALPPRTSKYTATPVLASQSTRIIISFLARIESVKMATKNNGFL